MGEPSEEAPTDLIPITEAAKLVPSPRPGRGTHVSTLYRWNDSGRLRYWRRAGCRWRFVSRAEVLGLLRPGGKAARPAPAAPELPPAQAAASAREALRRSGFRL